jgi:hypothetical protein
VAKISHSWLALTHTDTDREEYKVCSKNGIYYVQRASSMAVLVYYGRRHCTGLPRLGIRAAPSSIELGSLSALSMDTQRFVPSFVFHITGLIDRILTTNLQSALVQSLFRGLLNCSYRSALPGVSSAYQLTEYSLVLTAVLQSVFVRSPYYRLILPLLLPQKSERLLKVVARNRRQYALEVRPSALVTVTGADFVWPHRQESQTCDDNRLTPIQRLA